MSNAIASPTIWCAARLPVGRGLFYACTLQKGHTGPHKAHGEGHQVLKTWPQEPHPANDPHAVVAAIASTKRN